MTKIPFDLERAKAGEAFYKGEEDEANYYVGKSRDNERIVVEFQKEGMHKSLLITIAENDLK